MNLIDVTTEINIELGEISKAIPELLTDPFRTEVFNSLVTVLMQGLVDEIQFIIQSQENPMNGLKWIYQIEGTNVHRLGPSIREIVNRVPIHPQITSKVVWSQSFNVMSERSKRKLLAQSIWNDSGVFESTTRVESVEELEIVILPSIDTYLPLSKSGLESELQIISTKSHIISDKQAENLMRNIHEALQRNLANGVEFKLEKKRSSSPIAIWQYSFMNGSAIRVGDSIEDILLQLKIVGRSASLKSKLLWTSQMKKFSEQERKKVLGEFWQKI